MSSIESGTLQVPEHTSPPRSLWRNRDYLLLWSGQLVSSFGSQASAFAFPLLMLAITHSPAEAGLLGVLGGLPFALLCLPAGALVDRWDRRRLMIFCDCGRALALGSIPVAFVLSRFSVLQLFVVALIEGTLFTFFNLAETACLPNVVAKEQLATAIGQNQTIDASSMLVGPALSGFFYGLGQIIPFLFDALSYAVSVVSLLFMKTRFQIERNVAPRKLWTEIGEGLAWLWHEPLLRFLALLTCGLMTPCFGYMLILIVLAQNLHATSFSIGLLVASGGIGNVVGSLIAAPLLKRFSLRSIIIITSWLWALSWLPLAIAPNLLVLGIANAIGFVVVPIYLVAQFTYRMTRIPDHLQGRVNAVFRLIGFGSHPLGVGLTGLLLQLIGPVPSVVVLFIPQALLACVTMFHKSLRSQ